VRCTVIGERACLVRNSSRRREGSATLGKGWKLARGGEVGRTYDFRGNQCEESGSGFCMVGLLARKGYVYIVGCGPQA
jgi:hypothetical protein